MSNLKTSNDRLAEIILVKMMLLFGVNRIHILRSQDKCIEAVVGWPDQGQAHYDENEEQQEISWSYQHLNADVSAAMELLKIEALLRGDRIEVDRVELETLLSETYRWDEVRSRNAVEDLLRVQIDMVDEGSKADSFFLHF